MSEADTEQAAPRETDSTHSGGREDDGQEYLDRSKLDFDPDDGLYSGTAVDGVSEIPGPHEADGYSEGPDGWNAAELTENASGNETSSDDESGGGRHESPETADDESDGPGRHEA